MTEHFQQVESELRQLACLMVCQRQQVQADYHGVVNAIRDWETVCRRYEHNFHAYQELDLRFSKAFEDKEPGAIIKFEESDTHFLQLARELTIDICCFYIFAEIARRASESLVKRVSRLDEGGRLEGEFFREFGGQLKWFDWHVTYYRNKFIEHPQSMPRLDAIGWSGEGAMLGHVADTGLTLSDVQELGRWREDLKTQLPELGALAGWAAYDWICDNLEKLPDEYRHRAKNMITRVGTISAPPESIVPRLTAMFAGFLRFLRHKIPLPPRATTP